jgi:hypothetical protein
LVLFAIARTIEKQRYKNSVQQATLKISRSIEFIYALRNCYFTFAGIEKMLVCFLKINLGKETKFETME